MSELFQPGKWYVGTEHKAKSYRHHLVEALRCEDRGKLIPSHRYYVKIIGHWDSKDGFDLDDVVRFEMLLFSFNTLDWREVTETERNDVLMRRFTDK